MRLYIVVVICGLLALGGLAFYIVTIKSIKNIDKYNDIESRDLKHLSTPPPISSTKSINPEEDIPIFYKP